MRNHIKGIISLLLLISVLLMPLSASAFCLICIPCPSGFCCIADSFGSRNEVTFINDTNEEQVLHIQYKRCGIKCTRIKHLAAGKTYTFNCFSASSKYATLNENTQKVKTSQTWRLSKGQPEIEESAE